MTTRLDHRWVLTLTLATALCVLLLAALFVTLQTAPTTSLPDANAKVTSMSERDGIGGSNLTRDSFIDSHASVVARYHQGSLATCRDGDSITHPCPSGVSARCCVEWRTLNSSSP
jgi:hypothetical protein